MKILNTVVLTLAIIGCVNWLLVGLFGFNLVATLFGDLTSIVSRIIYVIVGICGLWLISFYPRLLKEHDE